MQTWPTALFACPEAGSAGELHDQPDVGWLCEASGLAYPVLGGCPILVPDPARWIAERRDAILAALVEHDRADAPTVALLQALVEPWLDEAPQPFADDWTRAERRGEPSPEPPREGPATRELTDLLQVTDEQGATRRIVEEVAARKPATIVEVGPGAGLLSAELARSAQRLALVDRSLRAVLLASTRAEAARQADLFGLVAEADTLCFRPGSVDAIVTANLVDLLDDPEGFVARSAEGLRPGGALVVCTPRPALRIDESDDALVSAVEAAGLAVETEADGLPWIRCHSNREYQLFLCQLVTATKR